MQYISFPNIIPDQSGRQVTSTSSVRYRCVTVPSRHAILEPLRNISYPACAIITPLSMQNRSSVAKSLAPRSSHIIPIISWRRSLQPTPPTINTSRDPQWAKARSVVSTSIAKMVSWREKQRSACENSLSGASAGAAFGSCFLFFSPLLGSAFFSIAERIPEKLTSIPGR